MRGLVLKGLVEEIISLDINEIESYKFPLNKLIGIEVMSSGIKFEFIAHFTDNPNLLCFGSGASARNQTTSKGVPIHPPYFKRWSWYKYFDENFIAYADPMFYLDDGIQLGWYVGDKDNWYLESISVIIKKLAINLNIYYNNILFYGSSGGGFSSILLGAFFEDSKVLVNNSQFNVMNWQPGVIRRLFDVLKKSFVGYSDEEIYEEIKHRLNSIELFKKLKYAPTICCYVNVNSPTDVTDHCIPFMNELLELPYFKNDLDIHFYKDNSKRHSPMENFKSIELIKNFAANNLYNNNSQLIWDSFKVNLPKGYYLKKDNFITNGSTTIRLRELPGDNIREHITKYIETKKNVNNLNVDVDYFKFEEADVWKTSIENRPRYINFWFVKYGRLFHFHTSNANDKTDETMLYLIKSLTIENNLYKRK